MPKTARSTSALLRACLAILIALQAPHSAAADAEQSLASRIDASIGQYFKPGAPGASVIVTRDGKTVFRKAYGLASVNDGAAMTPEAQLRLGSITKQFTAVAVLMLADQGKLSLKDNIRRHLSDYPRHGKTITIEHLLTHTSGIPDYTGKPDFPRYVQVDVTLPQLIGYFKNDPLEFEPGT